MIWQDPIPAVTHALIDEVDIIRLKSTILNSGISLSQLVSTAWKSAATFRGSDKRGGANGARIRLAPQKKWEVNKTASFSNIIETLEVIQENFNNNQNDTKLVSLADIIVLGGCVAIERAAKNAGHIITVHFTPGRTDATQLQTDSASFAALEPRADGFRNYLKPNQATSTEELLVDKAQLLTLTAPEMTVLIGGMRVLDTNFEGSNHGVFTEDTKALSNDFFVNLLDVKTTWKPISDEQEIFEGRDRSTGDLKWTATRADLIFGSNSELRALSEVYASEDSKEQFVQDFAKAWSKVMELDRFDIH